MEVTIRRVEFYEINQVVSFLIEQFNDIFLTLKIEAEVLIQLFSTAMRCEQCFIALYKEQLVGVLTYSTREHASFEVSLKDVRKMTGWSKFLRFYYKVMRDAVVVNDNQIYLNSLVIHPSFRRQGIATQLIEYLLDEIKVSEYLLDVMKTNQEALALYKKLGFKVIKKRFNTLILKLM